MVTDIVDPYNEVELILNFKYVVNYRKLVFPKDRASLVVF